MGRKAQKAKAKAQVVAESSSDEDSEQSSSRSPSVSSSESSEPEQQSQKKNNNKPKPKPKGKGGKASQQQEKQAAAAAAAATASAAASSGSDQQTTNIKKRQPVQALYCPVSGWPAEMCEYNGNYAKCKQWHIDNAELLGNSTDDDGAAGGGGGGEKGRKQKMPGQEPALGKNVVKQVVVDVRKRTGRKKLTIIKGMEMFGHQPSQVAQFLKKKFSCGTSVIEPSNPGVPVSIEMQGEKGTELLKLLTGEYSIPPDVIVTLRQGKPASAQQGDAAGKKDDDDDDGSDED